MTRYFLRTEEDVTYTLMYVPDQEFDGKEKCKPKTPCFNFKLMNERQLVSKGIRKCLSFFKAQCLLIDIIVKMAMKTCR